MRHLSGIQILRGLAALAVVTFHAREQLDWLGDHALPNFVSGAFGVDVFFVISGFVMVYASVPLFGTWRSIFSFLSKRLVRIVPLYWAVTILYAAYLAHLGWQGGDHHAQARALGSSLAFVPYLAPVNIEAVPVYPPGWTLDYEMLFYACFSLALVLPRRLAIAGLAASSVIFVALDQNGMVPPGWSYLASPQLFEFVAGMLLAEAFLAGLRLSWPVSLVLIGGGLAAMLLPIPTMDDWWQWRGLVWGLPAAAVVAGLALLRPGTRVSPARRWLEGLGDASYALYLVHFGWFVALGTVLKNHAPRSVVPSLGYMALLVASSVAVAVAIHRLLEAPVTRALQRLIAPRPVLKDAEPSSAAFPQSRPLVP